MSRSLHDVVIVGGGPAGSAAAILLAREGLRVLVLDRSRFPRPKPCGECLNPAAVAALDRLGLLPDVLAAGARPIRGWVIHPLRGPTFRGRLPPAQTGLAVPRASLDAILLDGARAAGAEVRLGERVTDLVRRDGHVAGVRTRDSTIPARLVIGADGLRSVVSRKLGLLRRAPRLRKLALAAHVQGSENQADWGSLHLHAHGCIGIADVGHGVSNVVVVVDRAAATDVAGRQDDFFDSALRSVPALLHSQRLDRVLATGPFDWPVRSAIADGALLVGDAAGYFDPFTGQGIYRALRGAELASAAAVPALRGQDCSVSRLGEYERARRRLFGPGERLQRVIEFAVARPRLFAMVAEVLARRRALASGLIEVIGDLRGAGSLIGSGTVSSGDGPLR